MFKVGDKVLFSLAGEDQTIIKSNIGIILKSSGGKYSIVKLTTMSIYLYKDVDECKIEHLSSVEDVRGTIASHCNDRISKHKLTLKEVTPSMKEDERVEKYQKLQAQIKATAKNLHESENDIDFENKLKAICRLKKELYTIELDCISDVRKANGHIWHSIKEIEVYKDRLLKDLSDENIEQVLSRLQ